MSFERIAKNNIKSLHPEAYAESSFAKRVMGSYTNNFGEPGMITQDSWRIGVVPDCYFHFWFPKPSKIELWRDLGGMFGES